MTSPRRRVHISGMGAVTALGLGTAALWEAARDGTSGVKTIALPRTEQQQVTTAAHLPDFDATSLCPNHISTPTGSRSLPSWRLTRQCGRPAGRRASPAVTERP